MKKFYYYFVAALVMCISHTANAVNIILNIDDPARVSVSVNYGSALEGLVAGDNALSVNEYESVQIKAAADAFLSKVVRSQEGAEDSEEYVSNMSECNLYISSYYEGAKYTVTTADASSARDGSCRIYVDDPSKVTLQRSGTYTYVDLSEGWNDVKYIKASELPLTIGPKNYGSALYQVKVNGEPVPAEGSAWRLSPADGDNIEIFANFPDVDVPVKFSYATDESKGFVTGVTVDGTAVSNYNDDNFTVKAGSNLTISGNTGDYMLNSFSVNGNSVYFYGQYNFIVTEATTISIDAKKYGTVKATLNVDNASNITVYRGESYYNDIIQIHDGDNVIELSETNTQIQIKPASGCFITSVTADGSKYSADYNGAYNIYVTEGMNIAVVSGAIERNSKAVVYIDSREAASQYFNFQRNDRSTIDIVTGYNEFNFYEGDNPFGLSWYGAAYANVYKNGEAVSPMYSGSTTYELTLADKDVVKIYLASDPETYKADITAGAGVGASDVTVVFDRISVPADWAGSRSVLPGTEIAFRAAGENDIRVSADGAAVAPAADGAFIVTVNKNTAISVFMAESGIEAVATGSEPDGAVYNLQGIRVADKNGMNDLPAGIYIVNGKKVLKH